jgi:hypothetical protein
VGVGVGVAVGAEVFVEVDAGGERGFTVAAAAAAAARVGSTMIAIIKAVASASSVHVDASTDRRPSAVALDIESSTRQGPVARCVTTAVAKTL